MPLSTAVHSGVGAVQLVLAYLSQDFYHQWLVPLAVLTTILAWLARPSTGEVLPKEFRGLMVTYLPAWGLCVGADWLQGPYVYALYKSYGFDSRSIAMLFVAGFGSSLFFSCMVGSVADRWGRKRCCLAYCVVYIISCLTKHFSNYQVLMFGRVTGGIATSILFSCFECWMVSEHMQRHRLSNGLLSYLFGLMFTSMYFVAIVAGLASQAAASMYPLTPWAQDRVFHFGGCTAPFDLSIVCLALGFVLILFTWDENYGESDQSSARHDHRGQDSILDTVKTGINVLLRTGGAVSLCVVVASFEGAMFAFVFNWTPALDSKVVPLPHGLVFALFMMSCMCGASVSTMLSGRVPTIYRMAGLLILGMVAFAAAALSTSKLGSLFCCFASFMLFEFCVGMYYPAVGMLKSEIVPERVRSTVYNLYRIPLNMVVVVLLLTEIDIQACFKLCSCLLVVALAAVAGIMQYRMPDALPLNGKTFVSH